MIRWDFTKRINIIIIIESLKTVLWQNAVHPLNFDAVWEGSALAACLDVCMVAQSWTKVALTDIRSVTEDSECPGIT